MKSILILLICLVAYSSYSQTWTTVDIDDNLSISLPVSFDKTYTDSEVFFKASTSLCNLAVERAALPELLRSNNIPTDLEHYSNGFIAGIGFYGSLEVLDSSDGVIENVQTKTLKLNYNGKVKHILFMRIDDDMYIVKVSETTADSTPEAERILSSIELK